MVTAIRQSLNDIMVSHLSALPEQLKDDARLTEDLGVDSLDALDLLMAINEHFTINIPAERLSDVETIADLADLVSNYTQR